MEKESFEDEEAAGYLNDTFVCIKVDREERPDIDAVYMAACQMLTGSGGWPLTIFMTPQKKPFFAGTYIPKTSRFGRMGLIELCRRVTALAKNDPQRIRESADLIAGHLGEAFQFDWSHEWVQMAGMPVKAKVAHMRLCHSRMFLTVAYPRETQEMVFDAHQQAFDFFKSLQNN